MKRYPLITFGRGGFTAYEECESGSATLSGYADPEEIFKPFHWWAHPPEQMTYHVEPAAAEGAAVVDMRAAVESREGFKWAILGPLVDIRLKDGECEACPEPSPIFAAAVSGNQFGSMLAIQSAQRAAGSKRGSLDSVGIAEYVRGWREHGARIGRVCAGVIVWEA